MRRPRSPGGRFIKGLKYDITAEKGFVEVDIGAHVEREVHLRLADWNGEIRVGQRFVACGRHNGLYLGATCG
jgi:hypothetical protein